ncbi:hypothetical protein ASF04_08490 [Duganella sp. Leaf61]|uniref:hypothetical protein n=1 Tax=Duganella sp. Leaf61 TaxID=1736227 RepID=UPI0006FAF52C|nr:hypothetical protein [Duganella sp. Leaf61]KQN73153.1 hypothetical protein ASF04_08490 [Duganella sp. Leaf61]
MSAHPEVSNLWQRKARQPAEGNTAFIGQALPDGAGSELVRQLEAAQKERMIFAVVICFLHVARAMCATDRVLDFSPKIFTPVPP